MTPERWQMVRGILQSAMELGPDERSAFLDRECASDLSLRDDVGKYLSIERNLDPEFLESPAAEHFIPPSATFASNTILAAGSRLGPYEVEALLGAGGMGEVYRARDTRLDRTVAIKVIPRLLSADTIRRQRFEREARAIAALQHPNICTLYDVGLWAGIQYLVMEYLDGETLEKRLQKGRFPLEEMLRYGAEIADGLDSAHRHGIVHRDLKPANIFLTSHGGTKVLDFGLAKLEKSESKSDTMTEKAASERLQTMPGAAMGTAPYMSPEQARGEDLDPRTDLFSLGAVLYEMATGKMAFAGKTVAVIHKTILDDTPLAPSEVVPTLPQALDQIVSKALEKDRDLRYQHAVDLRTDLIRLKRDSTLGRIVSSAPDGKLGSISFTRKSGRARNRWIVGTAAGLVILIAVTWWSIRQSEFRPHRISALTVVRPLTETGKALDGAISLDGHYVAYVKRDLGKFEVRLIQLATSRDVLLVEGSPLEIGSLHFSPDGDFVYFLRRLDLDDPGKGGVYRIATLGGPVTPLAADASMDSVTVSPDGKQIAYISNAASESSIVSIDPSGADRRIIAKRPAGFPFCSIEWSHSTDTIAAVGWNHGYELVRVDTTSGQIRNLTVTGWGKIGQPAWGTNNDRLYASVMERGGYIWQIWGFNPHTGDRQPLTSDSTGYQPESLSVSASGSLVADTFRSALGLWTTDTAGRWRAVPSSRAEGSNSVAWVGNRVVSSNGARIFVHDDEVSSPRILRSSSLEYRRLAPCGASRLVYWANDTTRGDYVAGIDVSTGELTILADATGATWPTCTIDGSTLIYTRVDSPENRVHLMRRSFTSGQSSELFESRDIEAPTISPDGKTVLFRVSYASERPPEWVTMPTTGGPVSKLPEFSIGTSPSTLRWASDGKSVVYTKNEGDVDNLWSVRLKGGIRTKLTDFRSDRIMAFDVSPDNRLMAARGEYMTDLVLLQSAK